MPFDGGTENYVRSSPELELLDKTMWVLRSPRNWLQGCMSDSTGTQHCIIGALNEATGYGDARVVDRVEAAISFVIETRRGAHSIVAFNDHPNTTYSDVMAVLRDAREILAANGV